MNTDAEVERILAMSDEEVVAALVAEGEDPAAVVAQMRKAFEDAVAGLNAADEMLRALFPRAKND